MSDLSQESPVWRDYLATSAELNGLRATITAQSAQIAQKDAEIARLREVLAHIAEYWNRDQNERAMADALWHILETAEGALSQESGR